MECEGKEKIYSDDEAINILRINRVIAFLVSIGFLFINVRDKRVKEKYDYSINGADLQIMASIFNLLSSLVVLYIAFTNSSEIISNENPN